jgi:hypothetical protein
LGSTFVSSVSTVLKKSPPIAEIPFFMILSPFD